MTTRNWRDVRQAANLDEAQVATHRTTIDEQIRIPGLNLARPVRTNKFSMKKTRNAGDHLDQDCL